MVTRQAPIIWAGVEDTSEPGKTKINWKSHPANKLEAYVGVSACLRDGGSYAECFVSAARARGMLCCAPSLFVILCYALPCFRHAWHAPSCFAKTGGKYQVGLGWSSSCRHVPLGVVPICCLLRTLCSMNVETLRRLPPPLRVYTTARKKTGNKR